jgi:hypothetical protein
MPVALVHHRHDIIKPIRLDLIVHPVPEKPHPVNGRLLAVKGFVKAVGVELDFIKRDRIDLTAAFRINSIPPMNSREPFHHFTGVALGLAVAT